jgi:hypothetical protein
MTDNYIITLECSKDALGELIATGLERHATITNIVAATKPEPKPAHRVTVQVPDEKPKPEPASQPVLRGVYHPAPRSPITRTRKVSGWDVYQIIVGSFHPQKTFRSKDLLKECRRAGYDMTLNSTASHIHRFREAGLITKIGGDRVNGFVHSVNRVVTRTEFERRR